MSDDARPRAPDRTSPEVLRTREAAPEWLRGGLTRSDGGAAPSLVTGHLAGIDDEGRLIFAPEDGGGTFPVAIGVELDDATLVRAARRRRRALVVRTADATPRWLLVGLVRERLSAKAITARAGKLESEIEGETLRITAERDLELRCGQASITLRRDGRIVLNGTNVLSASRGPNRIKGATIALN